MKGKSFYLRRHYPDQVHGYVLSTSQSTGHPFRWLFTIHMQNYDDFGRQPNENKGLTLPTPNWTKTTTKQNIRKWLTGDSDRSCDSTEETSIIKRQAYQGKKNRNNLYTHLHYFPKHTCPWSHIRDSQHFMQSIEDQHFITKTIKSTIHSPHQMPQNMPNRGAEHAQSYCERPPIDSRNMVDRNSIHA